MSRENAKNYQTFSLLPKEEKKQILKEALENCPRGTKSKLARYCQVGQRQVGNWLYGESWTPTEDKEKKLWEFIMFLTERWPLFSRERDGFGTISEEVEEYGERAKRLMMKSKKISEHLKHQINLLEELDSLANKRTASGN